MNVRQFIKAVFSKKRRKQRANHDDGAGDDLRRMDSRSSYMQQRRKIYVNMELPASEYDEKGRRVHRHYVSNRVRTAKYTPLTFVPKNLFEQFRNVANLYFLFLVILQCIPIFGVVEPAVSALPLIAILVITGIKDGIEDWKRNQSDRRVNNAMTHTLSNWRNVNIPDDAHGTWYFLHVIFGFFSVLAGIENSYAQRYRAAMTRGKSTKSNRPRRDTEDKLPLTDLGPRSGTSSSASSQHNQPIEPTASPTRNRSQRLFTSMRQRSNTIRSNMSSIFKPPAARAPYRPGSIPHSVLYRIPTQESGAPRRPSTVHPTSLPCAATLPDEPPASNCRVQWEKTRWQDINVGDYIMVRNDEDVPADIVILSTSDNDNVCYVETKNLDGETNLKVRQALSATSEIKTVHDCERAAFYIESEPPHVNLYQYSGVMKWQIDLPEEHATARSGVSHEKTEAITFNNVLLRGCVLRNTEWVIGVVVFTGDETKIMLNSGRTPSKRSKIAKATNPHVVANFVILAVICIVSSVLNSVQFRQVGSGDLFEYGINGDSASYSGFLTFWVTLILYQNIVPISLYISVEIVKTVAAIFIWLDLDMYHAPTDAPCIPKTWNISDDLGQIEYIFSDKTGTLTQNVMEFRKCTINGVKYGLGETEASMGAKKREEGEKTMQDADTATAIDDATASAPVDTEVDMLQVAKDQMYDKQAQMFENKHVGPNPTFVDPKFFDDLSQEDSQADAITHFGVALALCHTVIAERPDEKNQEYIEYKAQSPDEAALVATARDLGFVFLGRESNTLHLEVKGEKKSFELLNVLEFNSTRKRMSVIVKPSGSDKIVLYCKGADSVIFERLCSEFGKQQDLREQQLELRAATTSHLEDFANEGLRTLCLGYRLISPEEYTPWNKKFQEASASLYNREEKIDEVCEEIERNMLLMGGTAIEDRLQDGVPETIAELAKSGIKLWVLTGDKTETAINIGFACNLLSNDMDLVVVKAQTREDTAEQLQKAANMVLAADNDKSVKRALVIDGTTLKYALEPATKETLLQIGMKCASVLCCRVSPKQKAQVVSLVKKGLKVMTLAIGDGANDVSMIQEANVGIGISGLEGRQAVMASDYAIAQFRFLHKLLLVHGRWSYLRTAETIMGFFYKNIVWTFVLFWYQIFCQFSGSMMFDYSLVTLYNLVFTSLPIIFLGIWDQDVNAKISLKYPEMYRMGLRSDKFQTWRFWLTVFDSIFQSSVCFFFPYMLLIAGAPDPRGYDSNGIYEIGTIVSGIAVCVANFFVGFSMYYFTWIQTGIIALSILVYYAFVCIYAQFNTFTFAGQDRLFSTGLYWVVFILTVVACFLPRLAAKYVMHQYYPYDNDIVREIELVMKKGRRQSETTTLEAPSCAPDKQKTTFTNSEPLEYLAPGDGESDIKMQERRSP